MNAAQSAKALFGGLTAGLTATATALADGQVTGVEYVGIALAIVGTVGVVFGVPNAPQD